MNSNSKISIRYELNGYVEFHVNIYGEVQKFRTNKNREGLWNEKEKQVVGTCQFSLTGIYSTDYRRIERYFSH